MSIENSKNDDARSFSNHLTHIESSLPPKWKLEPFNLRVKDYNFFQSIFIAEDSFHKTFLAKP